jgi:hypothetical protein
MVSLLGGCVVALRYAAFFRFSTKGLTRPSLAFVFTRMTCGEMTFEEAYQKTGKRE